MRISDWSSDVCSSDLHRRGQDAVDEDRPAVLVDLVLHRLGVLGDLDDDVDFFGDVAAGGDVVEAHGGAVPAQGRRGLWAGCRAGRGGGPGVFTPRGAAFQPPRTSGTPPDRTSDA